MALMTPRGLKVRLDLPSAFSLLSRLWERDRRTDAFRVLKTCEAIESVPSSLGYVAAIVAVFIPTWPPWSIALALITGKIVGKLLTELGMFIVIRPVGLLHVAWLWSWISGYGILLISAFVLTWIVRGWLGVLFWILGAFVAFVAQQIVEWIFIARYHRRFGEALTSSEVNFFNAYRLHADRLDVTRDLEVEETEIATCGWRACFAHYAWKCPESVVRFPDKMEVFDAFATKPEQNWSTTMIRLLASVYLARESNFEP